MVLLLLVLLLLPKGKTHAMQHDVEFSLCRGTIDTPGHSPAAMWRIRACTNADGTSWKLCHPREKGCLPFPLRSWWGTVQIQVYDAVSGAPGDGEGRTLESLPPDGVHTDTADGSLLPELEQPILIPLHEGRHTHAIERWAALVDHHWLQPPHGTAAAGCKEWVLLWPLRALRLEGRVPLHAAWSFTPPSEQRWFPRAEPRLTWNVTGGEGEGEGGVSLLETVWMLPLRDAPKCQHAPHGSSASQQESQSQSPGGFAALPVPASAAPERRREAWRSVLLAMARRSQCDAQAGDCPVDEGEQPSPQLPEEPDPWAMVQDILDTIMGIIEPMIMGALDPILDEIIGVVQAILGKALEAVLLGGDESMMTTLMKTAKEVAAKALEATHKVAVSAAEAAKETAQKTIAAERDALAAAAEGAAFLEIPAQSGKTRRATSRQRHGVRDTPRQVWASFLEKPMPGSDTNMGQENPGGVASEIGEELAHQLDERLPEALMDFMAPAAAAEIGAGVSENATHVLDDWLRPALLARLRKQLGQALQDRIPWIPRGDLSSKMAAAIVRPLARDLSPLLVRSLTSAIVPAVAEATQLTPQESWACGLCDETGKYCSMCPRKVHVSSDGTGDEPQTLADARLRNAHMYAAYYASYAAPFSGTLAERAGSAQRWDGGGATGRAQWIVEDRD